MQNRKGGTNKKDAGTTGAYLQSFPRLKIRLPLPKALGYLNYYLFYMYYTIYLSDMQEIKPV